MDFYINLIMYILAFFGIIIINIALVEKYLDYKVEKNFLLVKKKKMRYYKKEN